MTSGAAAREIDFRLVHPLATRRLLLWDKLQIAQGATGTQPTIVTGQPHPQHLEIDQQHMRAISSLLALHGSDAETGHLKHGSISAMASRGPTVASRWSTYMIAADLGQQSAVSPNVADGYSIL